MCEQKEKALRYLLLALEEIDMIISGHENIQCDDEQYDDPELWWARPAKENILSAIRDLR